jgi:hypothetical protein
MAHDTIIRQFDEKVGQGTCPVPAETSTIWSTARAEWSEFMPKQGEYSDGAEGLGAGY